jgi:hypothetical protein
MDYRYTFTGVLHPERAAVTISTVVQKLSYPDDGIVGTLTSNICVSQIISGFETPSLVPNVFTLKNIVSDAVRVEVDAAGFLYGHGYDVEIVHVVRPDSMDSLVFGVDIPALKPDADMTARFNEVMRLFDDPRGAYLQRCFGDLREAIRSPRDTGFFCYRAIESLRQSFVVEAGAKDDKASWETLRSTLSVGRAEIDYIKGFADAPRHGAARGISDAERASIFRKTWLIVHSFIDFALAGYGRAV